MSLIKKIKSDSLVARKAKDTVLAQLLITLLGEAQMVGKNAGSRESTDEEVVAVVAKFIKNNKETMSLFDPGTEVYVSATKENEILSQYMPKQLTEEQLLTVVGDFVLREALSSPRDMGKVMAMLKDNYGGQYDGQTASKVVKHVLVG